MDDKEMPRFMYIYVRISLVMAPVIQALLPFVLLVVLNAFLIHHLRLDHRRQKLLYEDHRLITHANYKLVESLIN